MAKAPKGTGFGAKLIKTACEFDLQGEVGPDYAPEGVTCQIAFATAKTGSGMAKMDFPALCGEPRIFIVEDESILAMDLGDRLRRRGCDAIGLVSREGRLPPWTGST